MWSGGSVWRLRPSYQVPVGLVPTNALVSINGVLNGGKLSVRHLASMGKIQGTLRISRLIDLQKHKSVITDRSMDSRERQRRAAITFSVINQNLLPNRSEMSLERAQRLLPQNP